MLRINGFWAEIWTQGSRKQEHWPHQRRPWFKNPTQIIKTKVNKPQIAYIILLSILFYDHRHLLKIFLWNLLARHKVADCGIRTDIYIPSTFTSSHLVKMSKKEFHTETNAVLNDHVCIIISYFWEATKDSLPLLWGCNVKPLQVTSSCSMCANTVCLHYKLIIK
jgi:hypothetical protein